MKIDRKVCRHGTFEFFHDDELIGHALWLYGEYSEDEVNVFKNVLRPGNVAIDVGANIGAFTVPMSKLVGPTGKVIAFEPFIGNYDLLRKNLAINDCTNADIYQMCASDSAGTIKVTKQDAIHAYSNPDLNKGYFEIGKMPIDDLHLDKCHLIKIDVDSHELQVLKGATETIKRCNPVIYVENERPDLSEALIAYLIEDLHYRCYWHRPPQFNPDNFAGNPRNIFGKLISIMMICVPDKAGYAVEQLDEVSDIRQDDLMFDREIARYTSYVLRDPNDLMARLMIAHYNNLMQREEIVWPSINENLDRDPDHVPTLAIRGLLNLQRGKWKEGWQAYGLRFHQKNLSHFGGHRKFTVPHWDGKPTDETVLIWSEQGYGDMIMFARFMKDVLKRAPNAVLEVSPLLYELFEHSQIMPLGKLFRLGRTLPPYTMQCSLPSTPTVLTADFPDDMTCAAMMRMHGPYLFSDAEMVRNWAGMGHYMIGAAPNPSSGAKIGLCLQGSPNSERPYTRDLPEDVARGLWDYGPFFNLSQQGQFDCFASTAAAIELLDLVITVDTSIAHLAGAMGKPVWLLLAIDPDWRWGLHGEKTIWYPSMRIFRQPKFRDWKSVIAKVCAELDAMGMKKLAA